MQQAAKQKTVTPSATEGELLVLSSGVCELMVFTRSLRQKRLRIQEYERHHDMPTSISMGFARLFNGAFTSKGYKCSESK